MTISDLSYLTTESSSVTGGVSFRQSVDQYNDAYVKQDADSYAKAVAFRGNATAYADSTNKSTIWQDNTNYS
jgi:hypothetical protein